MTVVEPAPPADPEVPEPEAAAPEESEAVEVEVEDEDEDEEDEVAVDLEVEPAFVEVLAAPVLVEAAAAVLETATAAPVEDCVPPLLLLPDFDVPPTSPRSASTLHLTVVFDALSTEPISVTKTINSPWSTSTVAIEGFFAWMSCER